MFAELKTHVHYATYTTQHSIHIHTPLFMCHGFSEEKLNHIKYLCIRPRPTLHECMYVSIVYLSIQKSVSLLILETFYKKLNRKI